MKMNIFTFFLLVVSSSVSIVSAVLYVPPKSEEGGIISSSQFLPDYPNHGGEIDVLWRFTHSIQLEIDFFELDGQNGDFLILSDLPLTWDEGDPSYWDGFNGTEVSPEEIATSIVTTNGLLLSWEIQRGSKYQALSNMGTFLYFHVEAPILNSTQRYPFRGFNITVHDLDMLRTPAPTTTTEGSYDPPDPETSIYIQKFLMNPPFETRQRIPELKDALAEVGTRYCLRDNYEGCGTYLSSNLTQDDVNIPTATGLYMCDPTWATYNSCVELNFTITREENLRHLFPTSLLEDMWRRRSSELEAHGFFPYDDHPPLTYGDMVEVPIWMGGLFGLLLILMAFSCFIWVLQELGNGPSMLPKESLMTNVNHNDEKEEKGMWIDFTTPLRPIIAKLTKQREETAYIERGRRPSPPDGLGLDAHANSNPIFQEHSVELVANSSYDNRAYSNDQDEEEVLYVTQAMMDEMDNTAISLDQYAYNEHNKSETET